MGNFKRGLFIGSILGAGLMWLGVTKKGKEVREKILDYAAEIYSDLKNKILQSDLKAQIDKNKYIKMVKEKVDDYLQDKDLNPRFKAIVEKIVSLQWVNIKKEIAKKANTKRKTRQRKIKK